MLLTQTFKGSSQIRDVLVLENLNFVPDLWGKYEDYLLEVAGKKGGLLSSVKKMMLYR